MCKVQKHIFLGLEMEDVDCASILKDIDSPMLEISSESMFIIIIELRLALPDPAEPCSTFGTVGSP